MKKKWIGHTALGWLLGFVVVMLLLPVLESVFGLHGLQSPLPIGMALGIGVMQYFSVRAWGITPLAWLSTYIVPFAALCVGIERWADHYSIAPEFYIPVSTALSAMATGIWQAFRVFGRKGWRAWLLGMRIGLGWMLTVGFVFGALQMGRYWPKPIGLVSNFAVVLGSGALLGWLTWTAQEQLNTNDHAD